MEARMLPSSPEELNVSSVRGPGPPLADRLRRSGAEQLGPDAPVAFGEERQEITDVRLGGEETGKSQGIHHHRPFRERT